MILLKDFAPELEIEYCHDRNTVKWESLSKGSGKKVWWRCTKKHYWEASVVNRVGKKSGCPYCAGFLPIQGETDFATIQPSLCKEWDYSKNAKGPREYTAFSNAKVWWKCEAYNHSWEASINKRSNGRNCPICGSRKLLLGFNDLATTHPYLACEWHPIANGTLKASDIFAGSMQKVWWLCSSGHTYDASPNKRTVMGRGCRYCTGQARNVGIDDLATTHPHLLPYWDYEKNKKLLPTQVGAGSNKKVWWKCLDGNHSWKSSVKERTTALTKCPHCKLVHTSAIEQAIFAAMKANGWNVKNGERLFCPGLHNNRAFVDISGTAETKQIVIEYDGYYWHKQKTEIDKHKTIKMLDAGMIIIRIRAYGLPLLQIPNSNYYEIEHKPHTGVDPLIKYLSTLEIMEGLKYND